MNRIILSLVLVISALSSFAQITTYKVEPKKEDTQRIILHYDSLKNITRENITSLVGQQVQVLPYIPLGGSDLATGPTLYSRKPSSNGYDNSAVVMPDTRFTIYKSRFGAFDNQVFNIVGVDSIKAGTNSYPSTHFYLIVNNNNYPNNHYLEVGMAHDRYSYNGKLENRGQLTASNFIILGYFEKMKELNIGKLLVNKYENNTHPLGTTPILYNLSDATPLTKIPKDNVWRVVDYTFVDTQDYKGISYILTSDSIQDVFCRAYDGNFTPYDEYLKNKGERADWEKKMIRLYGKTNGNLIIDGKVKLGFSKKMCEEAWGIPSDINKSTGSWGTHEQWVYGSGSYLYFENGRLTAIDN